MVTISKKTQLNKKPSFPQKRKRHANTKKIKKVESSEKHEVVSITPPQEILVDLLEKYQAGNLHEAIESAKEISENYPDHPFSWKVLGAILKQKGKISEALVATERCTKLAPDNAESHNNLGTIQQELGMLEIAEASYKKAITLNARFAMAYNNLGLVQREIGKLEVAEESFLQSLAIQPAYFDAYNNLGSVQKQLGKLAEAEESYKRAIKIKPNIATTHNNLGYILQAQRKQEEAEASYKRAIALNCNFPEAHNNLGHILQAQHKREEAEASYKRAIALNCNFPTAHTNLGLLFQNQGKLQEAHDHFNKAIAIRPDSTRALSSRWQILFDKGDFEAALNDAEIINKKYIREYDLLTLFKLGRKDEVYRRIKTLSKLDPHNLWISAFATFLSHVEKRETKYNFCPLPLQFVHFSNLSSHMKDSPIFVADLIKELQEVDTVWAPLTQSTVAGFQSHPDENLFDISSNKIQQLKRLILEELNIYYSKFEHQSCDYIQKWPSEKNLNGWHIVLKHHGYQDNHIHPSGWLSGVIYLKTVPSLGKNEGAIEFSLNSRNYFSKKCPKLIFEPKVGDIVFFPSSLHHRTIPFKTDTDRIIVSFDLAPEQIRT